ncbi:MAG: nucleotidyltransferase family protein [Acidobacteriia bacterium]|nr:nucleotidyltransferase family protein [Terriglobia bacterium]
MFDSENLLLKALRDPQISCSFTIGEWDVCLRQASRSRVLARFCILLDQDGLLSALPAKVRQHLESARMVATHYERALRWEVNRLEVALESLDIPMVLLKGAAYVVAQLPPARGRLFSDIDIMVPRDMIGLVESTLLQRGWEPAELDAYDQRYYRTWMHELPPLRHRERKAVVDVHHNILPETGRLHPDPRLLLQSAQAVAGTRFKVLAPTDMVLHSAAHMFQDGELAGSLRDLTDLDDLFRHFGGRAGFWDQLAPRAGELDLSRPLFYALRCARYFFATPSPRQVVAAAAQAAPPKPILHLMDALVRRALIPAAPDSTPWKTAAARWLLYVRSHWLRMPPLLLARHLCRKSLRRFDARAA